MRDSAIWQLAACDRRPLVAAAMFAGQTIQIWCLTSSEQIGEYPVIGEVSDLVMAVDGEICISCACSGGLTAYSVPDGIRLWHRPDFSDIQHLTVDSSGRRVYCGFENKPLAVVDAATGDVQDTIPDALTILFSPTGRDRLIVERNWHRIEGDHDFRVPPESFRVPNAAFSPESVCIRGTVLTCYDLSSGNARWRHEQFGSGSITFASDYEFYCAVSSGNPPRTSLIRLAPNLLDCDLVARLGRGCQTAFAQFGEVLITSRGDVHETRTGRLLTQLKFLQRDYPDR